MTNPLHDIAAWRDRAGPSGIPSVCSANAMVLEAAMTATRPAALPLLIEATCTDPNTRSRPSGDTCAPYSFVDGISTRRSVSSVARSRRQISPLP